MIRVGVGELERKGFNRDFNINYTCKTAVIPIVIENISCSEKFKKSGKMLPWFDMTSMFYL